MIWLHFRLHCSNVHLLRDTAEIVVPNSIFFYIVFEILSAIWFVTSSNQPLYWYILKIIKFGTTAKSNRLHWNRFKIFDTETISIVCVFSKKRFWESVRDWIMLHTGSDECIDVHYCRCTVELHTVGKNWEYLHTMTQSDSERRMVKKESMK